MKKIILSISIFLITKEIRSQQNYCDFEGTKVISFAAWSGTLDSLVANPAANSINPSSNCAKYTRDTALYDNIKFYPYTRLNDVSPYASNNAAYKIRMKLFSTAPVGTTVKLQFGIRSNNTYPAGVHSEYIATTSTQNAWELITFNYLQSPAGSMASATAIDKIVLLFDPDSHDKYLIYFDDLSGPPLFNIGIATTETPSFKLSQNYPNPAKENTHIKFQLNSAGSVSLKLYDILGNSVFSFVDQLMSPGTYSIPVETRNIPEGIYFYILKKDSVSQTMKMVISK